MSESTWSDPRITAYVLDELSSEDRAAFEDEWKSKPELEAAVDEARLVTGKLEGFYAAESTPPLDADRRRQILSAESAAVVPMTGTAANASKRSWRLPAAAFAAAAILLLLLGLAPWLRDRAAVPTLSQLPQQEVATATIADAAQTEEELERELQPGAAGDVGQSLSVAAKAPVADYDAAGSRNPQANEVMEEVSDLQVMQESMDALAATPLSLEGRALPAEPSPARAGRTAGKRGYKDDSREVQESEFLTPSRPGVLDEKSLQQKAGDSGASSGSGRSAAEKMGQLKDLRAEMSDESISLSTPAPASGPAAVAGTPINQPHSELPSGSRRAALSVTPAPPATRSVNGAYADSFHAPALPFDAAPATKDYGFAENRERMPASRETARDDLAKVGRGRFGGGFGTTPIDGELDETLLPLASGDRFEPITDNPFHRVSKHPHSTFSVDVDTASYSKVRDVLMRANQLPQPDAVRIEEMVNYFEYDYQPPAADDKHPFAAHVSVTSCPWNQEHRLARIALQGKTMDKDNRPACNLVFLLDTSGSMKKPNKLPLVLQGMQMLLGELTENDKVAIVVYAGSAGLVLDSTSAGKDKQIRKALTQLSAGGSTNGGAGIALAYQTARSNFLSEGVNRVILCTDGDFNVGTTDTDALVRMVEEEAQGGIFLSVLGFGMGNHNDAMLEQVSGRGNGNYAFIDSDKEARKVLVGQTSGTLVTIAKDVKLQIEFNPAEVSAYRLIGYENRILAKEDFDDDAKDAGEIGAGHAVTALYEIVPAGTEAELIGPQVDDLIYQTGGELTAAAESGQMMTLKLRYKQPTGDTSTLVTIPVTDDGSKFESADDDVRFAAAVAGFGMQLRRSQYAGDWTISDALKVARASRAEDRYELRAEFIEMVRRASEIIGQE